MLEWFPTEVRGAKFVPVAQYGGNAPRDDREKALEVKTMDRAFDKLLASPSHPDPIASL